MNTFLSRRKFLQSVGGLVAASAAYSIAGEAFAIGADTAKVTQVRNATLLVDYAGLRFLIDPMLSDVGAMPGFAGTPNSELENPLVPLTLPISQLIDVDAVIVTHLHEDHWDDAAKKALPKNLPIFVQDEIDAESVRADGFQDVRVLTPDTEFQGVSVARTRGLHGAQEIIDQVGEDFGRVCGVAFSHPGLKTIYIAGDTVWNEFVAEEIANRKPDIIVLNSGDAQVIGLGSLIMGTKDVLAVHEAAPDAILVGSHMEAVNHCVLSRAELRDFAIANGFSDSLLIPADGETMTF